MHAAYRAALRSLRCVLCGAQVVGTVKGMEMHQVRYFLAVADTLNFTRAAEQCHVSQPALTRAIQQLEEELGGLLLRRERKLTHLTDFGQLIEPHLRQLAADAEAAKTTAKRFLNLQQAQIRLGVMCTIGPARFMGFLARFRDANPGCDLTLVEGVPAGLSQMLLQGELDLAVMAQPDAFNESEGRRRPQRRCRSDLGTGSRTNIRWTRIPGRSESECRIRCRPGGHRPCGRPRCAHARWRNTRRSGSSSRSGAGTPCNGRG